MMQEVDEILLQVIHSHHAPWLDMVMLVVTSLGGHLAVSAVALGAGYVSWVRGQKNKGAFIVAGTLGAIVIVNLLKLVFMRERPEANWSLVNEASYSLPSGHAMGSVALVLALVVATRQTKWRWPVVILGGGYVLAVGLSRVYLGVHYPSDVVIGWVVGATWVGALLLTVKKAGRW